MTIAFYDLTGKRGKPKEYYEPILADIDAGLITVDEAARKTGVKPKRIITLMRNRDRRIEDQRQVEKETANIVPQGAIFWVSIDRKTWRIAQADGRGGFQGFGWSVSNGALYEAKPATRPIAPNKKWKPEK